MQADVIVFNTTTIEGPHTPYVPPDLTYYNIQDARLHKNKIKLKSV